MFRNVIREVALSAADPERAGARDSLSGAQLCFRAETPIDFDEHFALGPGRIAYEKTETCVRRRRRAFHFPGTRNAEAILSDEFNWGPVVVYSSGDEIGRLI